MVKISIICTNYNKGNWIGEAIESFLKQETSFSYEIIIVDDASTDNSVEIIHPLGGKYLVRYLKKTSPIIVDTLDESLDIKGKHEATECELHEALHRTILDKAVQLAIQSKLIASQQK